MLTKAIELNDDGVSVKGRDIIYAPCGQAGEYSALACNPYRGCGHKCAYCYVPNVLKMPRLEFDAGAVPREDFEARLLRDAQKYQAAGITEQVMLSFTTDPYHPGDCSLTRRTILTLIEHGLGFCTLTKGGMKAARDIQLFRPLRDAFACTLTSLDWDFANKWERGAAPPSDRLAALKMFHRRGIFTWVSLEPVIDVAATLTVIAATYRYVDLYKVGRVNYVGIGKTIDWAHFTGEVLDLMARTGAKHYIKRDLQSYLPAGYVNEMQVQQHH